MIIKAKLEKIHRVNPNGILCDAYCFDKLKEGEEVEVSEKVGKELISMGVALTINKKKEIKNG
tara:strand:- start:178 stop:366 length:189 start_codon:yes stop_codon:yes gene_type:complete